MVALAGFIILIMFANVANVRSHPLSENGVKECKWLENDSLLDCKNINLRQFFNNGGRYKDLLPPHISVNLQHKIKRINLRNCNIEYLYWSSFDQYHIEWLNLSENPDIILETNSDIFSYSEDYSDEQKSYPIQDSLNDLDLSNCNQKEIPSFFRNLKRLNMENNSLKKLDASDFLHMQYLENIVLSNNKIKRIDPITFDNLDSLRELDLSNNDFIYMNPYLFLKNEQLKVLIINYSQLTIFPELFSQSLENLSIAHGQIRKIPNDALRGLSNLQVLNLSHNIGLYIIGSGLKSNSLTQINLTSSKLEKISIDSFNQLPNLKILNLANNNLSGLTKNHFKNNYKLKELKIHGNPWICDPNNHNFIEFRNYVIQNNLSHSSVKCFNTEYIGKDWKAVKNLASKTGIYPIISIIIIISLTIFI